GVVPWALGSDTGGSIRIPSSMCGTFGLKPTTGQLPLDGLMPLAPSLDCPGPIASTVGDLRLLYQLMARSDGGEPNRRRGPSGGPWRIGVPGGFFADRVHADVLTVVERVAETFGGNGAEVEAIDGTGIEDSRRVWSRICYPEFAAAHPSLNKRMDAVGPMARAWIEEGLRISAEERAEAVRRRGEIRQWFRGHLASFDVLLIPSTPYPALSPDEEEVDLGAGRTVETAAVGPGWITCSVNLAGLPALNLPAGRSTDGLPIGVSMVGDDDREPTLLEMALEWETVTKYQPSPPPIPRRSSPVIGPGKDPA
ncbi:MAG TPA: amidase, partial [Actinomycetota bacterium]|nr:amidase [Actinomycetota bacterium]